ncbi:MAG: glycine cleavage system protein H [Actinomycetia bacterium]|nr:glycine cleavage system protein H [Actinomycetes bacterium]
MPAVRNCNLPDDLLYLVEKHVWARRVGDLVEVGLTDVAQNMAKGIIAVTPKKVGRTLRVEQSVATVESGKWVGPVPTPVAGEIAEVNPAVVATPALINTDPYGAGWVARVRPSDWDADSGSLVTGAEGIAAYESFLDAEGIDCEG